jgi:hypothetical protein
MITIGLSNLIYITGVNIMLPTYAEYVTHANNMGFIPLSVKAFDSLIVIGFNPITSTYNK